MIPGLLVLTICTIFVVAASCASDSATRGRTNDADLEAERPAAEESSFEDDILPILTAGCRPCHFEGGKMYKKLPFDRPGTIRKLGERLFTRIKDERERAVVRAFLADSRAMSNVRVECHAGYRGEETPRRFHLEGRTIEIVGVLARWTEPDAPLFRVRGDDGRVYVLRLDERQQRWEIPEVAS